MTLSFFLLVHCLPCMLASYLRPFLFLLCCCSFCLFLSDSVKFCLVQFDHNNAYCIYNYVFSDLAQFLLSCISLADDRQFYYFQGDSIFSSLVFASLFCFIFLFAFCLTFSSLLYASSFCFLFLSAFCSP